jgi:nucleoside-diphosphate-sugar epimerase
MKNLTTVSAGKQIRRVGLYLIIYSALAAASLFLAYVIRFSAAPIIKLPTITTVYGFVIYKITMLWIFGQFRGVIYYFRFIEAKEVFYTLIAATVAISITDLYIQDQIKIFIFQVPRSVILIDLNVSLILFVGFRVCLRVIRESRKEKNNYTPLQKKKIAVFGAGKVGEQLIAELLSRSGHGLQPICLLDDNLNKHGAEIHGLPVIGDAKLIPILSKKYGVNELILTLPPHSVRRVKEISNIAIENGMSVLVLPSGSDLASGRVRATDLRAVSVEDLLGRDPARLDDSAISQLIQSRTVLVTGAGGSIGQEICRQIAGRQPKQLIILDQCEVLLYQTEQELITSGAGELIKPIIADVTDRARINEVFQKFKPDLVLHAAAHKHVPMMESQPAEALKNNSLGTAVMAEVASLNKVKEFVLISTDKAINPTNVMGASKRLAEIIIQSQQKNPQNITRFIAVRFGNVLGSSGSVIPLFKKQIAAGGPVTVTHPNVQRYFMTIPEAVGLVLQAATQGKGGDILVLEMGKPIKIMDLARQLIELSGLRPDVDVEIKTTGLRPGEKMVEELQHHGEQYQPTTHERIFRFIASPLPYEQLPKLIEEIKGLLPEESKQCKAGIKRLVPEYVPYVD